MKADTATSEQWRLYDACAEHLARRGFSGEIGDPLPWNLAPDILELINEDTDAFKERVRMTAYALAMETHAHQSN